MKGRLRQVQSILCILVFISSTTISADHIVDYATLGVFEGDIFEYQLRQFSNNENGKERAYWDDLGLRLESGDVFTMKVLNATPSLDYMFGDDPTFAWINVEISSGEKTVQHDLELYLYSLISTTNISNIEEKLQALVEPRSPSSQTQCNSQYTLTQDETTFQYDSLQACMMDGHWLIKSNDTVHMVRDKQSGAIIKWEYVSYHDSEPNEYFPQGLLVREELSLHLISDPDDLVDRTNALWVVAIMSAMTLIVMVVYLVRTPRS